MSFVENYWDEVYMKLAELKNSGVIERDFWFNVPINGSLYKSECETFDSIDFDDTFKQAYLCANGARESWHSIKDKNVQGKIELLQIIYVLQDWKSVGLYADEDVKMNDLIQYYKPIDMLSETESCGILITPDFVGRNMYFHNGPEQELYDLDIDFHTYLTLAKEVLFLQHWPQIILDIKNNRQTSGTDRFKSQLMEIIPEFDWEEFVKLYDSLRLNK